MEMISRDKALMNARPEYLNPNQEKLASYNQGWNNAIEMYCRQIAELPTIEERKEGKWIEVKSTRGGHECSKCHKYAPSYQNGIELLSNYCPNCGADMREES